MSTKRRSAIFTASRPNIGGWRACAFTLVELLVVITIIVILLALLTPALDKAVYQTELVQCAANQKVVAQAAINYAFDNKRWYPARPGLPRGNTDNWINPIQLQHPLQSGFDFRPVLRDKMGLSINKNFQCALLKPIDLETAPLPDEFVFGNQALWFGWRYQLGRDGTVLPGMDKLGDRFEWVDRRGGRNVRRAYSLLVSDYDLDRYSNQQAGHPDKAGVLYNMLAVRQGLFSGVQGPAAEFPHTVSQWWAWGADPSRGDVDLSFAYDDGSVIRVNDVARSDPELEDVPNTYDGREGMYYQVPVGR